MAEMGVIVRVDPRLSLDEVAKALEKKGLTVRDKIPRARSILGSSDSSSLEDLKSVEGVELVRPEKEYRLPPMDEKIPQ